jgi:hypothetical protein
LQGWPEDSLWWQGWSSHFFAIFLTVGFIWSSSHSSVTTMILYYYQLNDSLFVLNLAGFHWGFSCNKSKMYVQCFEVRCHVCILTWFWNIGPFHFIELLLGISLFLCLESYAKICLSCRPSYPSHLKEEISDPFLVTLFF